MNDSINDAKLKSKATPPKIVTILGARPQFIKAAVVSPAISTFANEIIIHTGQHFDTNMSDIFFQELSLPKPQYHLNIHSSSHADMTGRMLIEIEKILMQEKPDLTLVYGDTNSTLAGALAAAKLHIPIAHVEAGVRSYNRLMPEEINRIVTDQLSTFFFVTSQSAKSNLEKEGCTKDYIYNVGDVMHDLALKVSPHLPRPTENDLKDYILVTLHRAENTNDASQLQNLKSLIEKMSKLKPVVWIMHPRTKKAFETFNIDMPKSQQSSLNCETSLTSLNSDSSIHIIEPVGYKEMMHLVKNAFAVATDSGGLQKEAYYYKKPCITLRNETEWEELCELGWNLILGDNTFTTQTEHPDKISLQFQKIESFLNQDFSKLPHTNVYGDGTASEKISHILKKILM